MKTVFLHIGMHKTATTTIQESLRINEDTLADFGCAIPSSGVTGQTHNNVAFDIRGLSRFDPKKGGIDDLVDEMAKSTFDSFIVSAEALDYLESKEIAALREKLSQFDVRIIVFLRRQVEWLQSEWSELVKLRFYQHDFATLVDSKISRDRRLSYFEFLEPWSSAFGKENLRVVAFEKGGFRTGNVFLDFLEVCEVPADHDWQLASAVNVSPSIKTLEVIRKYVHHYSGVLSSSALLGRCRRIVEYAERHDWNGVPLNLIDRTIYMAVQKRFQRTNDGVAEKYLDRERLFSEDFEDRPVTEYDVESMNVDEVLRLTAWLEK